MSTTTTSQHSCRRRGAEKSQSAHNSQYSLDVSDHEDFTDSDQEDKFEDAIGKAVAEWEASEANLADNSLNNEPVAASGDDEQALDRNHVRQDSWWGWICVIGCFMMHVFVGGFDRCFGVIYAELVEDLKVSAATAAGIAGVMTSLRLSCGPLASALSNRFGTRKVSMVGGFMYGCGLTLSAFRPHIVYNYLTLGVLTGLGGAMLFTPAFICVNYHFTKWRAAAIGVSTAGTGVGTFVLPLFTRWLLKELDYRSMMIIVGGIAFNLVACGAVFRPVNLLFVRHRGAASSKKSKSESEKCEAHATDSAGTVDHKRKSSTDGDGECALYNCKLTQLELLSKGSYHDRSLLDAASCVQLERKLTVSEQEKIADVTHKNGDPLSTCRILIENSESESDSHEFNGSEHDSTLRSTPDTPQPALATSTANEMYKAEAVDVDLAESANSRRSARICKFCSRQLSALARVFDVHLLRDVEFLLFCITCALTNLAYQSVPVLLVHYAKERGLSKDDGADLIAVGGVADMVSRAATGFIFAAPAVRRVRKYVWATDVFAIGVDIVLYAFASSLWQFWICAAIFGLTTGIYASQLTVIAADLVPDKSRVPSAIGLTIFFRGTGVIIGPFVAGLFRDITGQYSASFIFCGCVAMFGAVITTLLSRAIVYWRANAHPERIESTAANLSQTQVNHNHKQPCVVTGTSSTSPSEKQ